MISNVKPRDVLLFESDPTHRAYLAGYLAGHGYDVAIADDQQQLVSMADRQRFGLALVDAAYCSPRQPASHDWARRFCGRSDLGVILLSTIGGSRESVRALKLGADDYVSRPFHEAELLARIRAVMRRYPAANADSNNSEWQLNLSGRNMRSPEGTHIRLTGRELDLLSLLSHYNGEAVSRDRISETLMGREWIPGDRSMDVLVRRLRSKLDPVGGRKLIQTERHVGYRLAAIQVTH